jgi:hypothetical protein
MPGPPLASVGVPAPVQDHRVPRQSGCRVGQHGLGSCPVRVAPRPPAVRIGLQAERELPAGDERLGQPVEVAAEALSPAPLDSLGQAGVLRLRRQALFRQPDQLGTAGGVGLDRCVPVALEEADRRRDRLFRHT